MFNMMMGQRPFQQRFQRLPMFQGGPNAMMQDRVLRHPTPQPMRRYNG